MQINLTLLRQQHTNAETTLRTARRRALAKATAGRQDLLTVTLVGAVASTGCGHHGSKTVGVGRLNCSTGVVDCRKQRMFLNIVKPGHTNLPAFKDVSSTSAAGRL